MRANIKKIQDMQAEMVLLRQKFHAEPELAMEERTTSRYVLRQLQLASIEAHHLPQGGVIGILHGRSGPGGKAIMLRAEMDAVAMKEETGVPYSSRNEGAHHACGHDGHMAMLLGAAKYLSQTKDFNGTVYFVFQPAEESQGGAKELLEKGLWEKYPCDEVYALHNNPSLPLGSISTASGALLAASDEFHISLDGVGEHISRHGNATDLISASSEMIAAINALAAKELKKEDGVIAVTAVHTNTSGPDASPAKLSIKGSIRTYDAEQQALLRRNLRQIVLDVSAKYGATPALEFKNNYAAVVNTQEETNIALEAAKDIVGEERVQVAPRMLAKDDFSTYLQEKPGNYTMLGTGRNDGREVPQLHSPRYDFNDVALQVGASYWVRLVERALSAKRSPAPVKQPTQPEAPKP
jgi:amidohydrolase